MIDEPGGYSGADGDIDQILDALDAECFASPRAPTLLLFAVTALNPGISIISAKGISVSSQVIGPDDDTRSDIHETRSSESPGYRQQTGTVDRPRSVSTPKGFDGSLRSR